MYSFKDAQKLFSLFPVWILVLVEQMRSWDTWVQVETLTACCMSVSVWFIWPNDFISLHLSDGDNGDNKSCWV